MNYVELRKYELQEKEEMAAELICWYLGEKDVETVQQILAEIVIPGAAQCTIEGKKLAELIDTAADDYFPSGNEPSIEDRREHLKWSILMGDRESLTGRKIVQNMTTGVADFLYDLYQKNR